MRDKRYPRAGKNEKIDNLIVKIKQELQNSIEPISLSDLNSYERKLIHRHFDHNPNIVTKTYRHGEDYELRIYPIGNLRNFARQKADEALKSGERIVLPHMSNYERFIIHDVLKDYSAVKSESQGDDDDRHIVIEPEVFGRGLRKIIKKIKLF
jgi:predicted RNA-binding protein Jag